ncbi:hypothetical protein OVO43_12225, partial [Streptococcus pneumoniae]|nr:hypothetical protein [Streptococcus pneumoniae]
MARRTLEQGTRGPTGRPAGLPAELSARADDLLRHPGLPLALAEYCAGMAAGSPVRWPYYKM